MRIRYGRLSTGRDNSYTMVFSSVAGERQAKMVSCRLDIVTPANLDLEVFQPDLKLSRALPQFRIAVRTAVCRARLPSGVFPPSRSAAGISRSKGPKESL
jgi:hypothetical protein